jgi:hypothetical protein
MVYEAGGYLDGISILEWFILIVLGTGWCAGSYLCLMFSVGPYILPKFNSATVMKVETAIP